MKPLRKTLPPVEAGSLLDQHLGKADFSVRLLRYWWAGQALAEEAARLGRPLVVVDVGCERGWLKFFTPAGAVGRWVGLDWNPRDDARAAGYDEVLQANFDEALPVGSGEADVVVSLHVFEHLPRPGVAMAEVARLLRPGGIFLGGAPTMPDWLARLRERYFRRKLEAGELVPGGHITVLSPSRWRNLAHDSGLDVEFATGSHAVRMTGSWLESSRLWVRLNQFWGGLFPSLGSECYLQARRRKPWVEGAIPLPKGSGRPRLAWAAALLLLLGATGWVGVGFQCGECVEIWARNTGPCPMQSWIENHQDGQTVFIVVEGPDIPAHILIRKDVRLVGTVEEALSHLKARADAHILVDKGYLVPPNGGLAQLAHLRVDSRLNHGQGDYFLLKNETASCGTLGHYLKGM
ncbi:MAG: class I SAM-dependent methyltransferase [Verrucomicrobiales bacterium]